MVKTFSGADEGTLTSTGQVLGTPRAMAPEQIREEAVNASSDSFSLGVLLYELATARLPFRAFSHFETLARVTTHRQPPARELEPRLGAELSEPIDRLLEKDPGRRPASAAEVAAQLARIPSARAADAPGDVAPEAAAPRFDASPPELGSAAPTHHNSLSIRPNGNDIKKWWRRVFIVRSDFDSQRL